MHGLFLIFLIVFSADMMAADDDSATAQERVVAGDKAVRIRATLLEMKAIADARADYNERWVKFLREGKFGDADPEVVTDPRRRLMDFTQTFCGKQQLGIVRRASGSGRRWY